MEMLTNVTDVQGVEWCLVFVWKTSGDREIASDFVRHDGEVICWDGYDNALGWKSHEPIFNGAPTKMWYENYTPYPYDPETSGPMVFDPNSKWYSIGEDHTKEEPAEFDSEWTKK